MYELRRTSSGSVNLGLVPMFVHFSIVVIVICEPFVYYCVAISYFDCTDVVIEQVTC